MPAPECDKCGRDLPGGGTILFASPIPTTQERLGRYGRDCARKVVIARAEHGMLTYGNGRELPADGRRVAK